MTPAPRKPRAKKAATPTKKPATSEAVAAEAPVASPEGAAAPPPPGPGAPAPAADAAPSAAGPLPELPAGAVPMPATAETVATPVEYTVPRPNLLDTGLSDYSFWVSHVAGLRPEPLPKDARTGRIWA